LRPGRRCPLLTTLTHDLHTLRALLRPS
jgi:hypothetical protein